MIPKRSKPSPHKLESPLDAKKREIAEQEARNRAEMEKCQKVIEGAPERAEKLAQAKRDELTARASQTDRRRASSTSLPDSRYTMEANAAAPRRLRAERRQGRLHFFLLLLVLLGLTYWLFLALTHS